jgi:hypothetical protein
MRRAWLLLALGAVYTFYVWMFVASEGVVLLARHGACTGPDVIVTAKHFAADWRHGMTGHSPLYLPGFFLLSAVTWLWANDQPVRRLLREAIPLLAIATLVGIALAPRGTAHLVGEFVARESVTCTQTTTSEVSPWRLFLGLFTLTSWSVVIAGINHAVARRGWRVLRIPAAFAATALALRPPTRWPVIWVHHIADGKLVAIASVVFIPLVAAMLMRWRLAARGRA